MPYPFRFARRATLALAAGAILSACAHNPPVAPAPAQATGLAAPVVTVPGYGDARIMHTSNGRLRLSVPEQRLAFDLDPEVISARLLAPAKSGPITVLPVQTATSSCANRVVAYIVEGARVRSMQYISANCAVPMEDRSAAGAWTLYQDVSATKAHAWTLNGGQLKKQVIHKSPAASGTQRPRPARSPHAAPAQPDAGPGAREYKSPDRTPVAAPQSITIDLMD